MHRVVKYDLLRLAACLAVVLLHVSGSYWNVVDVNSADFATMTIYNTFGRFGVPVFLMLSGLFLLNPEKEFFWEKWLRKMLKLCVGFFLWSFFYAFQSVLFHGIAYGWNSVSREMWNSALSRFIIGHYHMWFLLDLLGFYLLLPVLRKICEDIRVTGYFILLWILFQFVFASILPCFAAGKVIFAILNSMHIYALTGYIGYFMLGYYLDKIDTEKWKGISYIMGAGAPVFSIFRTIQDSRTTQEHIEQWLSPSNICILIFSIAVFVLFKNIKITQSMSKTKYIAIMAECTFFVYMVHPFFIEKLNMIGIKVIVYPVALAIPVMTVVIFIVSILTGWLAGRIPIIGKWITLQ